MPISNQTILTRNSRAGFTLFEMLVVVALIALIMTFSFSEVSTYFRLSLNSATREMATKIREAYHAAALTGQVHRVVYDLKNNKYWVESGPPDYLLHTKETLEKEEQKKKFLPESQQKTKEEFKIEKSITPSKLSLPKGVRFKDIYTEKDKEPITDGTAYTHFFPHDLTERTLIHLTDAQKHDVSLEITSLLGKTRVDNLYITPEDFRGKK